MIYDEIALALVLLMMLIFFLALFCYYRRG